MSTASEAFNSLLKTLCLHEFPCGTGSWRKKMTVRIVPLNYGKKVLKLVDKTEPQFSVTLADYDPSKSHIETLQEFVSAKHSPWTFDYSWSEEAKSLREVAVKSPEGIDDDFVYNHFRTLRLTDKGITEVDERMLCFKNLEYLTLSANYIKNVNSKNLPRKLLSLELNSNEISELFSLCVDPPELVHLGLGNNCLAYVDDYLSGDHWPTLLSLDLSYNNLTDLPETLRKLKTLPNLRNLILMGNPLMLTPGYRGFVIDNLKRVDLLDDTRIEADERHRFLSMSKLTEQELASCNIQFSVGRIKNAPQPMELQNPEEQPEFPIITRKYYVEFQYIEEGGMNTDVFQFNLGADTGFDNPFGNAGSVRSVSQSGYGGENFPTPRSGVTGGSMTGAPNDGAGAGTDTFFTSVNDGHSPDGLIQNAHGPVVPAKPVNNILRSDKGTWSTDIDLSWSQLTTRDDLLAVRDFLKTPMTITVMEETILSYPKEEEEGEKASSAKKKKDAEPKKDEKKPKKKKEPDQDSMRHEPPEYNVLATFEIDLSCLLNGEDKVEKTLMKHGSQSRVPSGLSQQTPTSANGGKKDKNRLKSAEKKGGGGKDAKGKEAANTERKKSAGKKDGKKKEAPVVEAEPDPSLPPPPLEVNISVQIVQWKSTSESIPAET